MHRRAHAGEGDAERLMAPGEYDEQWLDWSADGRSLLFTQIRVSSEIMVPPMEGGEAWSFPQAVFRLALRIRPGDPAGMTC